MTRTLEQSSLPLPLLRRGKVREVYDVDAEHLLLVASDRVSAFDVVMRETIPHKGAVLTQLSRFWFERLAGVIPSHYVTADADAIVAQLPRLTAQRCSPDTRTSMIRRSSASCVPAARCAPPSRRCAGSRTTRERATSLSSR